MSVNAAGELVGRMEAIGPRETWEPVFEEVSHLVIISVFPHFNKQIQFMRDGRSVGECVRERERE